MKIFQLVVSCFILVALTVCTTNKSSTKAFYLSHSGNDNNSGTKDKPFATLEKARDAVRELKHAGPLPDGGITIYIRGGTYTINKTFILTENDSGTEDSPVIWRSYPDESVHFIGGRIITGFEPINDPAILERIDLACRNKILQTDLKNQGINNFGMMKQTGFGQPIQPAALELFFQGKVMTVARYPNEGWMKIASVPQTGNELLYEGHDREKVDGIPRGRNYGRFMYEGDRPERWTKADDIWLHGYWSHDWADQRIKVINIDTEKREIDPVEPKYFGYAKFQRYYAYNILEELDRPGEWYLDRKSGMLYFWPPSPIGENDAFVSVLEEPMISLSETSYITLQGLTFEGTRAGAITIEGGSYNKIAGCIIRNIGNVGIIINGGTHNGILSCDIYETGDGGVQLNGGDRKTLTSADNYVDNCHIYSYNRVNYTYRSAVLVSGVGNRVTHCHIHDAPHNAILFRGNEHLFEYNDFHNVCLETGEVGAFYCGRDWTMRGTVIRYNYIHNIVSNQGFGSNGIHLDDAISGITIFGNIFNTLNRGVSNGGGRDNIIENNIFINCSTAVSIDGRALTWGKGYASPGGMWRMYRKLEDVNYKEPPYSIKYPELATILNDNPREPRGTKVLRNISYNNDRWLRFDKAIPDGVVVIENNLVDENPGFIDMENNNFNLKDESPAYKLGFKPIPFDEIGLYEDKYRKSLKDL